MHGLIFAELKKYVVDQHGGPAWNQLMERAGLGGKVFLPNHNYADEDAVRLVAAAAEITGRPSRAILASFGEFIAPDLYRMYNAQINPAWKALDLIENTEPIIHRQVRLKTPGARPPRIQCIREAPDRVVIQYTSDRRMCDVAKGIAKGIGAQYGQTLKISEQTCMHDGATQCEIIVEDLGTRGDG